MYIHDVYISTYTYVHTLCSVNVALKRHSLVRNPESCPRTYVHGARKHLLYYNNYEAVVVGVTSCAVRIRERVCVCV